MISEDQYHNKSNNNERRFYTKNLRDDHRQKSKSPDEQKRFTVNK